ncbi:MAG: hypothetical protein ACQEUT_02055 [Bacillota bacterium]
MEPLFHFFLLFLSLGGLGAAIYHKLRIHKAFIPIFLYSLITFLLFFAGILNILPLAANIIYYAGLFVWPVLLYRIVKRKQQIHLKKLLTPALIFFITATAAFMFLLDGVYFTHYDNFSHWALIVKEMYLMGGLPDDSTVITFRNYPPGSALFIYFILASTGYAESYALMAQSFLTAASLTVLFTWTSWKNPLYIILSLLAVVCLVSLELSSIFNLIVDKTLGMVAFTSVFIAWYYRHDWKKNIVVNVPILVLLILLKDSGKLFVILNGLLILGIIVRSQKGISLSFMKVKFLGKVSAILFGIPILINYLWMKYTEKAYTVSYEENKYAVTGSKVTSPNKSEEFIQSLFPNMMQNLIDLDSQLFLVYIMINVAMIISFIGSWLIYKKASKLLIYAFLFCNFSFAVYIGSLFLMYLYLMPEPEAVRLASYDRYLTTIVIYLGAVGTGAALLEWSKESSQNWKLGLAVSLALTISYPTFENGSVIASKPDINDSVRAKVVPAVKKIIYKDKEDPRVLYYSPESKHDGGYLSFITLFEQLSHNYKIISTCETPEDADTLNSELKKAQFLVVLSNDNSKCLSSYTEIDDLEGLFKVNAENDNIHLEHIE